MLCRGQPYFIPISTQGQWSYLSSLLLSRQKFYVNFALCLERWKFIQTVKMFIMKRFPCYALATAP